MNASDVLKYGHLTVLRTLERAPQLQWETPGVCGHWSVKEIIAHLASFECVLVEVLNGYLGGGPTLYLDRFSTNSLAFNDYEVGQRQDFNAAETLAEYKEMQTRTMGLIRQIPHEIVRQAGTLPWYGREYALDDFIVYAYYGHKREHCAQIAVFADSL